MALPVKPTKLLDWAVTTVLNSPDNTANKDYGLDGSRYQDLGWLYAEFPPYQVQNEWMNRVYLWNLWVQEAFEAIDSGSDLQDLQDQVDGIESSLSDNVGAVSMWMTETPPAGYIFGEGAILNRTTYADLFAVYGTRYGVGDGSTTFGIPDFRGEFVRGHANGSTNDPDRDSRTDRGDGTTGDIVGTKQDHELNSHRHLFRLGSDGSGGYPDITDSSASNSINDYTDYVGGNETRPRNIAVKFIIKY